MSYDLGFWRYRDEGATYDHGAVYRRIARSDPPTGLLEPLAVGAVRAALGRQFRPRFTDIGGVRGGVWEGADGSFEASLTRHGAIFGMSHNLSTAIYNEVIDVMRLFECPLYDPQTDTRYRLGDAS